MGHSCQQGMATNSGHKSEETASSRNKRNLYSLGGGDGGEI